MERAVAALTAALSTMQQGQPAEELEEVKYADMESLLALQNTVSAQQEGQERLLGTVANLSHEQEVDKEHIKVSYLTTAMFTRLHLFFHTADIVWCSR